MKNALRFFVTAATYVLTSLFLWVSFLLLSLVVDFVVISRTPKGKIPSVAIDCVDVFYPLMFVFGGVIISRLRWSSKNIWLYPLGYGVFLIISLLMRQPPIFRAIEFHELLILLSPIPLSFMVAVLAVKRNWGSVHPK